MSTFKHQNKVNTQFPKKETFSKYKNQNFDEFESSHRKDKEKSELVMTGETIKEEESNEGWRVYEKKKDNTKKFKKKPEQTNNRNENRFNENKTVKSPPPIVSVEEPQQQLEVIPNTQNALHALHDPLDNGQQYKLPDEWTVWIHSITSDDWTPNSYKKLFTINNLNNFWEFFGNLDKLDFSKQTFYIMRSSSSPQWEHETNRDGGICSLRIYKSKALELMEQLAITILNDSFSHKPDDINGISFCSKLNWCIIKIWNKDYKNDIAASVPLYMSKKYDTQPRYKKNEPEY